MPKRTRAGKPVNASLAPACVRLDLQIAPPRGDGSKPRVTTTVHATRQPGHASPMASSRPQELTLTLKVHVVLGGPHPPAPVLAPASVCNVLEATWSDAGISHGLRAAAGKALAFPARPARPQSARLTAVDGERDHQDRQEDRRKRQRIQETEAGPDAESTHVLPPTPTPPLEMASKASTKRSTAAAMGGGRKGAWTATAFRPGKASLSALSGLLVPGRQALPSLSRSCPKGAQENTLVILVDGTSPRPSDASSGWAFAYKPGPEGIVSGRSEHHDDRSAECGNVEGSQQHRLSSGRAKVQAVLAALEHRDWAQQGQTSHADRVGRVLLVTASYHLAKGLTAWLRQWVARQWLTSQNLPVQDRDLWQRINDVLGRYAAAGCEVSVWLVPRARLGREMVEEAANRAARQMAY